MSKSGDDRVRTCPVQVVVRGRTLNEKERSEGSYSILSYPSHKEISLMPKAKNASRRTYTFDAVFSPETTQEELFRTTVEPIVNEALKGFNCTIFAYGQTGTGKTHTMEGAKDTGDTDVMRGDGAGIIPRSVRHIFEHLDRQGSEYTVRVSFLELYNEELIDLLGNSHDAPLKIYEDRDHTRKGVTVHGLEELPVNSAEDIFRILERGLAMRHAAETKLNKNSSRSHCIFSVIIHTRESTPEGEDLLKVGKLNLVDLAGAENIGRSGATDARRREAMFINQSLVTLGRVITSLVEKNPHIPYRESKLTRLLQESLGGRTKTCIIATVTPASSHLDETLSTLDYALRAKNIRNKPEINQKMTKRALIKDYMQEIDKLRNNLEAARNKDGFYITRDNYDEMSNEIQERKQTVTELETQLNAMESSFKELQNLFSNKEEELADTTRQFESTKEQLDETNNKLNTAAARLARSHQVVIEQTDLLKNHQQTEQQLHQSAKTLLDNLTSTLSEVDALHRKLERKKLVEEENKRKNNQFLMFCMNRLSNQLKTLDNFQHQQSETLTNLEGQLTQWNSEWRKHSEQLSVALKIADEAMTSASSVETFAAPLGNTSEILQQSLDRLRLTADGKALLSEPSASLRRSATSLREACEALTCSVTPLKETSASISQSLAEPLEALRLVTTQLGDPLQQLLNITQRVFSRSQSNRESTLQWLQKAQQEQRKAAEEREAHILKSVEEALRVTREAEESQWTSLMNDWQRNAEVVNSAEVSDSSSIRHTISTAKTLVAQLSPSVTLPLEHLETTCLSHVKSMNEWAAQVTRPVSAQVEALEVADRSAEESLISWSQSVEKEIVASQTAVEESLQLIPAALEPSVEIHKAAVTDLTTAIEATQTTVNWNSECWEKHVTNQTDIATSWQQESSSAFESLKGEVTTFFSSLKEDIPTGSTPVKKTRTFPTSFPSPLKYDFPSLDFQSLNKENDENGVNSQLVDYF